VLESYTIFNGYYHDTYACGQCGMPCRWRTTCDVRRPTRLLETVVQAIYGDKLVSRFTAVKLIPSNSNTHERFWVVR